MPILPNDAGNDGRIGHARTNGCCIADATILFDDETDCDFASEATMFAKALFVTMLQFRKPCAQVLLNDGRVELASGPRVELCGSAWILRKIRQCMIVDGRL